MSQHPIVHIEIPAEDPTVSSAFYGQLFGWQMQTDAQMDYTMFAPGDGPGGGLPRTGEMAQAGRVLIYVGTDSVDGSLAKASELGAQVVVPKTEIPGMGWFGVFIDPTGNSIGVFEAAGMGG